MQYPGPLSSHLARFRLLLLVGDDDKTASITVTTVLNRFDATEASEVVRPSVSGGAEALRAPDSDAAAEGTGAGAGSGAGPGAGRSLDWKLSTGGGVD